jgi:adenylyltransferase/sulfurtransferase
VGRLKVESAREAIRALNPEVAVKTWDDRLTSANALDRIGAFDVVVDGSDNFPTRYLVNDACVLTDTPLVSAAIFRFEGQASVFATADGPCYRCLHPEPPPPDLVPSCAEGGVLGVLPGIMGSIEALEAIKLITGAGQGLAGRLLLLDALTMTVREVALRRDPACPACGEHRSVTELIDYEAFCGVGSAGEAGEDELESGELRRLLDGNGGPLVVDVRQPHEVAVEPFPDALAIPLDQLPGRLGEIDPHRAVVAVCQRGQRSRRAVELLRAAGFGNVRSLRGGIEQWDVGRGSGK